MSDLIERLRDLDNDCFYGPSAVRSLLNTAADEIERLQARVEALEAALLKYGDHDYDCEIGQSMPNSPSPCNCGFLAATEQGEEK